MDSSYWSKLSPEIVYQPTRKQFYNRFCYKLVIEAHCARVVQEKGTVADEMARRRKMRESIRYNYGGSWMSKFVDNIDGADELQLETLRSIRNGYGDKIKMRIEEPWVQIYSEDLDTLKAIASRFPPYLQQKFLTIFFPESEQQKELLESGKILVKSTSKIGYKYKVFLRDGQYTAETKKSVHDYLAALGSDVKVSAGTRSMLLSGHGFMWGCFLYTNDPAVLTMVSIICPTMVGKIHELVDAEN